MNLQLARKLQGLQDSGKHLILIHDHPYVDTPVKRIYEDSGNLVYDSEVFEGRELSKVASDRVTVAKILTVW